MSFPRRLLATSKDYITKEEHNAAIATLEARINSLQQSVNTAVNTFNFPNWSKLYAVGENHSYTFLSNGYLLVGMASINSDRWIDTNINGRYIRWSGDSGAYKYGWGCMQIFLPISKNTPFSFSVNHRHGILTFAYFLEC